MKKMCLFFIALVMVTSALFSQNDVLVIEANGKSLDDVVRGILLDWEEYHSKKVSIRNVRLAKFGVESAILAFKPNNMVRPTQEWINNPETYRLLENTHSATQIDARFIFWFQPGNREAREFVFNMLGKSYPTAKTATINGFYWRVIAYNRGYNPFFVSSFIIDGKEYTGTLPSNMQ